MAGKVEREPWWKSAVIYQIYPRSFKDSNNDGIGDLKGIISKLDYLNDGTKKSLGIDALWISPIYKSPMKDFGYDISDYRDIDRMFGTLDDFKLLLQECHRRNIKVLMDLVVNHTSDEHPWFKESRQSLNNPKRDWYLWQENKGAKPNNWFSQFEMRNAWWLDKATNSYYLGTFTRYQPELNWRNPELKREIFDMISFWLDLGVDGFRMDVVNWFIKDERLRNNPWKIIIRPPDLQRRIYDRNRPETHDICKEVRAITDRYEDRMLVGEIFTNDAREAVSYHGSGNDELHMAFNFSFLFQDWSARGFYKNIMEYYHLLPQEAWPNFTLSNHDQPRHYFRYRKGKETDARARVAAGMLMTLRGTPFIYYGEEIGMTCQRIARRDLQDPIGKRGWPIIQGRDPERTPMQWDDTLYAGFSSEKPWLPVNTDYKQKNVMAQIKESSSLFNFYRQLIWLRKESQALSLGTIEFLNDGKEETLIFQRRWGQEEVTVILNFTNGLTSYHMTSGGRVLLGTHRPKGEDIQEGRLNIHPYEVLLVRRAD